MGYSASFCYNIPLMLYTLQDNTPLYVRGYLSQEQFLYLLSVYCFRQETCTKAHLQICKTPNVIGNFVSSKIGKVKST